MLSRCNHFFSSLRARGNRFVLISFSGALGTALFYLTYNILLGMMHSIVPEAIVPGGSWFLAYVLSIGKLGQFIHLCCM